ncbi:MAG TPA: hypothetical protein PLE43_09350 [Alphaproteobacteria bacterium]|nr:hypothetical protein [Alphaproteobacteria bacterium]
MSDFTENDETPLFPGEALPHMAKPLPPGKEWICRPFITLKNGKRLFASAYGKQAFCFPGVNR